MKLILLLVELIDSIVIEISVDDTLCHRTGARFFGAGMYHDGANSSRGGMNGPAPCFAFGHNGVIVAIKLPLPWGDRRAIAIPAIFRLYRSKKLCPEDAYNKRTQLAREMLELMRETVPAEERLLLAGDSEDACRTLLLDLPAGIEFVGPIHMKAALHGPVKGYSGKGRPIKLIFTRDPARNFDDRAYFTTDLKVSVETTLERMAARWLIEVSF